VQKKDSLDKIAARYGVSSKALLQRNNLSSPDRIVLGRTLIIPAPVR
jgi:LysM repeat protein